LQEIAVPGPLVCINVDFRDDHGVESLQFGYINQANPEWGVQWTSWANGDTKSGGKYSQIMNCVDDGVILGLRVNTSGKNGYTVGDIQTYNQCTQAGCIPEQNANFNEYYET